MSASFRSKVAQLTRSDPASHPESSLLDQPLALKKELLNLCMDWGHDHHWSTRAPCKCYCTQTHSNLAEGKEWSRSMPFSNPLLLFVCPSFVCIFNRTVLFGGYVCFIFLPQSKHQCHHQVTTPTLGVQPSHSPHLSNFRLLLHSLKHQGFTAESPR